ncbi:ALG6, ALG8 glycosyltransferase family-domain-containing protein [Crassisporium funariophilum]|nr:ALG6, ALG8 glycosyltransferase family-domain-containing protein [Crassisporium funariophilum]
MGMGRRWIRWLHKGGMKAWVVPGIIGASTLVKFAIGLGSYSGQGLPPMFGDYEAQRHWMELTLHLPMREWYTYDLAYWGLDYPPLTAYVSWLCGTVAHRINPSWVALDVSRGIESPESKLFMRMSVLVLDAVVYVPALLMFARTWQGSRSKRTQELSLLALMLQPALLLIDFGHFQYNSIMLGFTLLAMNCFATGQDLLGAFFFVLSLGFKQMALYYAPAIGSYLLAKCLYLGSLHGVSDSNHFPPPLPPLPPPFAPLHTILDPISRIFPFSRGLFEDKVANFWCASNVVFKWKEWASAGFLVRVSAGMTGVGVLPAVGGLLRAGWKMSVAGVADNHSGNANQNSIPSSEENKNKTKSKDTKRTTPFLPLVPYALLTSSMSFFLFSFQVHEKTILLPLLPITLLMSGAPVDSAVYSWGALVNNVAVFSMWPLLKREGLGVQYIAMLLLWNRLIGYNPVRIPKSFIQFLSMAAYTAAISLHILELLITPPTRYPDLFAVLNLLICTPIFVLTWLWSIKCGVEVGWALGGLGSGSGGSSQPAERKGPGDGANGIANANGIRQSGQRAVSLGFAQSRRRGLQGEDS